MHRSLPQFQLTHASTAEAISNLNEERQGERERHPKAKNDTESRREAMMCRWQHSNTIATGRTWMNRGIHMGMALTSVQPRWRSARTCTPEASRLPSPPCMGGQPPGRRLGKGVPTMMPEENKAKGEHNTHTNAADREAVVDNTREVGARKQRVRTCKPENNSKTKTTWNWSERMRSAQIPTTRH